MASKNIFSVKDLTNDQLRTVLTANHIKLKSNFTKPKLTELLNKHAADSHFRKNEAGEYLINMTKYIHNEEDPQQDVGHNSDNSTKSETDQDDTGDEENLLQNQIRFRNARLEANVISEAETESDEEIRRMEQALKKKKEKRKKQAPRRQNFMLNHDQRKQASDLRNVTDRDPKTFQNFILKLDQMAMIYDWCDKTINAIVIHKLDPELLSEVNFNISATWADNKKALKNRFGLNFRKLKQRLENFTRLPHETASRSCQRMISILNNPAFNFNGLTKDFQEDILLRNMRHIFPTHYLTFQLRWADEGRPVDLTRVQDIVDDVESMIPIQRIPQINELELDSSNEGECFAFDTVCFTCGEKGHFSSKCTKRVSSRKVTETIDYGKMIKEVENKLEKRMDEKFEVQQKQNDNICAKLDQLLTQNIEQPQRKPWYPRNSYPRNSYPANSYPRDARHRAPGEAPRGCYICKQTMRPYHYSQDCPKR